jgi:hypothetical protein
MADLRMKRVVREKECRAHGLSSRSEVARLLQRSVARHRASPKAGRKEHREKRHRQGRDNSDAIPKAAPVENSGVAFFQAQGVCRASVSDASP